MGLLQRSFLDLADQGDQELELAIVVDGTDSMAAELAGVRESIGQMLDDLRRYRNNEVRVALVVYRDSGSPSGDVVIPLGKFTSDKESISKAVESLQPETGAPYFHELPDLGLHRALTELPWSADNQVTKWILMFGDAPPYAESYQDAKTPQAYRRFATPILVAIAKQKNIRINCVLCTSGDNVAEPYRQAVEETRAFMSAIAGGTDGLMLDLSYDDIRTAMIDAGRRPEVGLAKLQPISEIDLAAVRRDRAGSEASAKTVKLAVIPHMPLNQISFDPAATGGPVCHGHPLHACQGSRGSGGKSSRHQRATPTIASSGHGGSTGDARFGGHARSRLRGLGIDGARSRHRANGRLSKQRRPADHSGSTVSEFSRCRLCLDPGFLQQCTG